MKFKQKFGYMFIGCLFTLTGYFFASLGGSLSPPNTAHAHEDERHFEKLVCKEIVIVNKYGKQVVNISASEADSGGIDIFNKYGKQVVAIGTAEDGTGILNIANEDGKVVASIETTDDGRGSIVVVGKDGEGVAGIRTTKDGANGILWATEEWEDLPNQ